MGLQLLLTESEEMGYKSLYGHTDSAFVQVPFDEAKELAIKLTESRQQSAEVAFKSRVLGADLASELVKANDDVYRISKSLEISSGTNKLQSQIILYIPPPKSTFRQIFPRQYLPPEVIESMQRIEELGSVK